MAEERLVWGYPVISIRPTIDRARPSGCKRITGRADHENGQSGGRLIQRNLKYSNGEPVKVVIADTTIGR